MTFVGAVSVLLLAYALSGSPTVSLTTTSVCPSAEQLKSTLAGAVSDLRIVDALAAAGDLVVEVVDRGESYQVSVNGVTRELPDPARRCEERARAAAVIVALALQPQETGLPPTPRPTPTPPVSAPRVTSAVVMQSAEPARRFEIEAAARMDAAPGADGGTAASFGAGIRAALTGSRFGITAGTAFESSARLALPVPVALTRIPLDLGGRLVLPSGRTQTAFDLGLAASILMLHGAGLGGNRLDLGVRAAIEERLVRRSRFCPFLALEMVWSPRPFDLAVESTGIEGQTPSVWLGLAAGVATHFP